MDFFNSSDQGQLVSQLYLINQLLFNQLTHNQLSHQSIISSICASVIISLSIFPSILSLNYLTHKLFLQLIIQTNNYLINFLEYIGSFTASPSFLNVKD